MILGLCSGQYSTHIPKQKSGSKSFTRWLICWARGLVPQGNPSPWCYVVSPQNNSNCLGARGLAPMQFKLVFCSPLPLVAKRSKSFIKTKSVQVSSPPEHRTITPCTFTERQKAFIGLHHQTKISKQKQPINH